MADYIFTSGTCLKSELYDLIISKLIDAGWQNVSSNPATEYDVLTSKGKNGDRDLVLQLRPLPAAGTAANNVKTSNYCVASFRMQTSYIPGSSGSAGTFGRSSQAWTDLYLVPVSAATGTLPTDTTVNYKVYADASKVIMAIEYPLATTYNPLLFYLGEPDSVFMAEKPHSGMVFATTAMATTAANLLVCDTPQGLGASAAPYAMPLNGFNILKNPNNDGLYFQTGVYYQSSTEGVRGMLDGVLCLPNMAVQTGNTITIDGKTYYQLVCQTAGNNSFPYPVLLVRTA